MSTSRNAVHIVWFLLLAGGAFLQPGLAQAPGPAISTPHPGDVLQGVIAISGTSQVDGFDSSEIDFTYSGDQTGTWFLISASSQPVSEDILASWDTTIISDGTYDLRLRVHLADGKTVEALVTELRVRNYTPVETPTPMPTVLEATPLPTVTPTPTLLPTPTSLPPNPVTVTATDVVASLGYGLAAVLILFVILGIYLWLRRRTS
jgi:hypothetical protein